MHKYSIIVPVYQCYKYLTACVESILNQDQSDFELILVDDGSKDGSADLCDELAKRDNRIQVIHKPNGGVSSARNTGLEHARGEYILFIDGDDTISSDYLKLLNEVGSNHDLVIFGMEIDYYCKNSLIRKDLLCCNNAGTHFLKEIARHFSKYYSDNQLSSVCNKAFKREILEQHQIRFREGMTVYEDLDFVLRVLQHTQTVLCIDQCLYYYRVSVDKPHIQRFKRWDRIQEDAADLNKSFETLFSQYPEKEILNVSVNHYMMILQQYLIHMKPCKASVLAEILPRYCAEEFFQFAINSGGRLKKDAFALFKQIENGEYSDISAAFKSKQRKSSIKQCIKRFIGK